MKLLLIEDDPTAVKGIKDNYEDSGWSVFTSDFNTALERIKTEDPDIIVMDWMEDLNDNSDRGREIYNSVYNKPIIVFSGAASALELENKNDNTFIEKVSKGDEQVVINKIDEWEKRPATKDKIKPHAAKNPINFALRIFPPNNNYP